MPSRTELRQLARLKLREAEQLYDAGYYYDFVTFVGEAFLPRCVCEVFLARRIVEPGDDR